MSATTTTIIVRKREQEEVDLLRDKFNRYSNGGAFLSKNDFIKLIDELTEHVPKKKIISAFECAERTGEGNIPFSECVIVYGLLKDGHFKDLKSNKVFSNNRNLKFVQLLKDSRVLYADGDNELEFSGGGQQQRQRRPPPPPPSSSESNNEM
jgi:hypothetical protein